MPVRMQGYMQKSCCVHVQTALYNSQINSEDITVKFIHKQQVKKIVDKMHLIYINLIIIIAIII